MEKTEEKKLHAILGELSVERIRRDVERIAKDIPSRLAGSENGKCMAEYSLDRLREAGVRSRMDEFPGLVSFPEPGSIEILGTRGAKDSIAGHTLGHSPSTSEDGLEAQVIYIGSGSLADYQGQDARGKITLSELSYHPARQEKLRISAEQGAVGCIMMNWGPPDNPAIPFGSVKAAWGTPTPAAFAGEMPALPCVGVSRADGLRLRDLIQQGALRARMHAKADNAWRPVQNTIGEIGGGERDLVVAGGHQDSWFGPQATDNASGSACLLELARVFNRHSDALARDLLFGFWTGHETGTMIGSTRFVDRNWHRLRHHAVAYLQIDQPSCAGTTQWSTASNIQLRRFHQEIEEKALDGRVHSWRASAKVGDASFVGLGVPMFVGQGAFTPQELQASALATYGWWHHSVENTLDKIDWEFMSTHIRIYAEYLYRLCTRPLLPFEFVGLAQGLRERLETLDDLKSGLDLDFPLAQARMLAKQAERLDAATAGWRARCDRGANDVDAVRGLNHCMRMLNQLLLPLQNTIKGRFGHDPYGFAPLSTSIPLLYDVSALKELRCDDERYWMLETELVRASNHVGEVLETARLLVEKTLRGVA